MNSGNSLEYILLNLFFYIYLKYLSIMFFGNLFSKFFKRIKILLMNHDNIILIIKTFSSIRLHSINLLSI